MENGSFTSNIPIEQLTESQKKAVFHVDGPLLVLAGPGSGKTRVIISRVAALINSGVRPYNICAITFTNKAAEEMRQRLSAMGAAAEGVLISTFHSLCVRILRRYAEVAGVNSNFSIYNDSDQSRIMKEAIRACDADVTNFTPSKMLEVVGRFKNDLEDPESVQGRADDYFAKIAGRIYERYQKLLSANNALDFDDLLVKMAFLLRDKPDVRVELSNRFKYLLVDEYQDTNHAQYQIAKGLALEHGNICVTGDPDQSIYKWRGADIANIMAFETDWPDTVVVKLEENFRSTPNILTLADKLISSNRKRKQKVLIPTRQPGKEVEINSFSDETEEAFGVALRVKELMDNGSDLNNVAVFYRVNSMSRAIEEALIQSQLPYQIVRGVEFYSRKEIRDMLSYLKIIANPDDDLAFLRALNTHPRGIGKTTAERLILYAHDNGLNLSQAGLQAYSIESIAKATRSKLAAFAVMLEKFRADSFGKVASLMERVFTETGLENSLKGASDKHEGAIENINELINAAGEYDQQMAEPSLVDYLQTIALYSDTDAYDSKSGKVSLMTLHAAKGLEFDHVFVIGLEEGILPHERSAVSEDDLEEERRLFFVGMTRARDDLNISYARHRVLRGQYLRTVPSQFLYEIGFDYNQYASEPAFADAGDSDPYDDMSRKSEAREAFVPGELVEHHKFGMGRVKEFLNLGEDSIVIVKFNTGKVKSLMVKYAKLSKVS